jgi:ABC-type amino acid transport substrate-binding protein
MDETPTSVERRTLRVANTLAALDLTGFSRETAEGIVGRLGGAEIEWVPVPFNQLFCRALNEMKADGTLSRLLEKWFPGIESLPELT